MATKIPPLRHSLPPKPQVTPVVQSDDLLHLDKGFTAEDTKRRQSVEADPAPAETAAGTATSPDLVLSSSSLSPGLTDGSTSLASLHDISPFLSNHSNMLAWNRSYCDGAKSFPSERPLSSLTSSKPADLSFVESQEAHVGQQQSRSMNNITSLTEAFSKAQIGQSTASTMIYQSDQTYNYGELPAAPSYHDVRSTVNAATVPLLIPMQASGDGLPLTSVVETLASKGSRAAAENPETVAHAWKLRQWGIGIGPGVNPKVVTNRTGGQLRSRNAADDPPIVNTGNSGPMCVQPGDWICTACGFVNWRRRKVCMRCYPFAEGNEVCQGIHGGELLAKRLAGGLDPTSEEFQHSLQALYPDRPKRTTEANPHHYHQMQKHEQRVSAGCEDWIHPDLPNVLGIHMGGQDMGPYSPYIPQNYAQNDYAQHYRSTEQHQAPLVTHQFIDSAQEQKLTQHAFSPVLHKSIWAPAPKRPVPIPIDPEDRDSADRRAKLQPIGTKSSVSCNSKSALESVNSIVSNGSGNDRVSVTDMIINNSSDRAMESRSNSLAADVNLVSAKN